MAKPSTQSLSTFSSHMTGDDRRVLKKWTIQVVLFDETGSWGLIRKKGAALAIDILMNLVHACLCDGGRDIIIRN